MRHFNRNNQSGNILLALFAGIAMIGLLGVAITNFMQGPLRSSVNVSRNTVAETQMLAASKLVAASASTSPTGDCDSDGLKEPPEWKVATGAAGTFPAGGGHVPDTLGAAKTDPWGTPYGYCGWDHGSKINDATCGGSVQKRLGGGTATSGIAISMISAGPDKIFQTSCAADPNYVTKPSGSDDVVMNYTVAEMNALGAGGSGGGGALTTMMAVAASGAYTKSSVGDFDIYKFTGNGTFEISELGNDPDFGNKVEYLIVGGGGYPTNTEAGAGAGGVRTGSVIGTVQSYNVVVGAAGINSSPTGKASTFAGVEAKGGGSSPGGSGSSGGGGRGPGGSAGSGTAGQGYAGCNGFSGGSGGNMGGGGGAGGPCTNNIRGGPGISSNITGITETYGCGQVGFDEDLYYSDMNHSAYYNPGCPAVRGISYGTTYQNKGHGGGSSGVIVIKVKQRGGSSTGGGVADNLGDHIATKDLAMSGYKITGAGVPILLTDLTNKAYVDSAIASASGGGGGNAAPFGFADLNNVLLDTRQRSNIVQLTGITGDAAAEISGDGEPSYRICADSACGTVLSDWTTSAQKVTTGMWVQLQTTTIYKNSLQITVGLKIGSTVGNWKVRTRSSVAPFTFTDLVDRTGGAITSSWVKIESLGSKNLTFSLTSTGDASYRIGYCSNTCTQPTNTSLMVPAGYDVYMTNDYTAQASTTWFVQLKVDAGPGAAIDTVLSVNEASDTWSVTTKPSGFMVLSSQAWNGNLGGLAGANAKCLADLQSKEWKGKADAVRLNLLTSANVQAALCTGTTCQNTRYPFDYFFAVSGNPSLGGGTAATYNTSSRTFRISADWSNNQYFGSGNQSYWTNRGGSEDDYWVDTPRSSTNSYHCSNWTVTTSNGAYGQTDETEGDEDGDGVNDTSYDQARAYTGRVACSTTKKLLCMVQPPP